MGAVCGSPKCRPLTGLGGLLLIYLKVGLFVGGEPEVA